MADYPIYKVIFNPDRSDLGIGPESLWDQHRLGAPVTVFRIAWRYSRQPLNDGGAFTIPDARPGRYLVALYDGGESGQHYSWESFTVTGGKSVRATPAESSDGVPVLAVVVIGVVAAALGFGAGLRLRRRAEG